MATDVSQDRLAGTWQFAPVHSAATFSVKYLVAPFRGEFTKFDAQLVDGKLSGAVEVASISVKDENLATHLQSADFFDAEQFPQITFSSDEIRLDGDKVTLTGQLTLKGVTKPLTATGTLAGPTEDFMGNTRLGLALEAVIDRSEYGVSWNAPLPKGGNALGNDVTLNVELEFHKVA
jgi:polyisoprenoid-binding protein YceI